MASRVGKFRIKIEEKYCKDFCSFCKLAKHFSNLLFLLQAQKLKSVQKLFESSELLNKINRCSSDSLVEGIFGKRFKNEEVNFVKTLKKLLGGPRILKKRVFDIDIIQ